MCVRRGKPPSPFALSQSSRLPAVRQGLQGVPVEPRSRSPPVVPEDVEANQFQRVTEDQVCWVGGRVFGIDEGEKAGRQLGRRRAAGEPQNAVVSGYWTPPLVEEIEHAAAHLQWVERAVGVHVHQHILSALQTREDGQEGAAAHVGRQRRTDAEGHVGGNAGGQHPRGSAVARFGWWPEAGHQRGSSHLDVNPEGGCQRNSHSGMAGRGRQPTEPGSRGAQQHGHRQDVVVTFE